ncbi:MAG: calpain family cysteine protease, partial [archaeon]|nr:calpain family cysteine protease [archaeon]
KIQWARIGEVFKHKDYKVFDTENNEKGEAIGTEDIIQGSLSDCYFLSAVAALAQRPEYIEKLFEIKEKKDNSAYGVYYCINGEWKLITLDDYFPVTKGPCLKKLAFSSANGNEFWVCLLEKAWAKINGNYINIGMGGVCSEVFDFLTEAWSEAITIKEKKESDKEDPNEELWEKLKKAQEKGFILTSSTRVDAKYERILDRVGLVHGHAYSILGLHEFGEGEDQVKLLALRNPWSYKEWTGDYCDDSPLLTKEMFKEMKLKSGKNDDGVFCMCYEDFCKYFGKVGICYLGDDYYYITKKVSSLKSDKEGEDDDKVQGRIVDRESGIGGPVLTRVNVTSDDTDCYFKVHQKNPRVIPSSGQKYKGTVLQYIMLVDEDYNYLASECNTEPITCIRYPKLQKGTYYLITDVHYRYEERECGYVISAYSDNPVEFINESKKKAEINDIINKAAGQLAEKIYNGEETEGAINKTLDEPLRNYPKKKPDIIQDSVTAYVTDLKSKRVPFKIFHFVNNTNQNAKANITVRKSGKVMYEVYCNNDIPKDKLDFSLDIPPKGENTVLMTKYKIVNSFNPKYTVECTPDTEEQKKKDRETE